MVFIEEIILSIIENFGYLGIFLLISIENLFPPIPSEIILLFGGFITTYTNLNLFFMIIVATLASLIGAICLYQVGRILNKDRIKKLIKGKLGKILHLEVEDVEKANDWFDKKGSVAVFFCRFIPIVRSLISIPAGMNKMNIFRFVFYTLIGTLIWNGVLIIMGSIVGENWNKIASIMDKYSLIVLLTFIILSIVSVVWFYYKKNKKSKEYNLK